MSTTSVARRGVVAVPLIAGAAVAVALGVYGRLHQPTGVAIDIAGFSSFRAVKTWLATLAAVLGLLQLATAAAMYRGRPQLAPLHRWSGRAAVLVTLPVVAHCLYALGFQYGEPRVLIHSLLGCFFYGAFVVKMLVLTRTDAPSWLLPVAGGAVFTGLIGLWLTSALWFFTTFGVIR
ncbi:DUF6529 family protein [Kribbella sp. NPDC055110]